METTADYTQDIPERLALDAHRGTSFVPEQRAGQTRAEYAATLEGDHAALVKSAGADPGKLATLAEEFPRYREGYRKRYTAWLATRSRIVSTMIAGPSNFPVRQMEKRNNVERRRCEELVEFRQRALDAIHKKLHPELRPIMAGDSDAVQRLRAEIDTAEKVQERMKTANQTIRKTWSKGRDATIAALVAAGFKQEQAEKLTTPDCLGGLGFQTFSLTNNGANIRRMKQRLEGIERNQARPVVEKTGENGITMEDDPPANRVRLYFDGKPAEEIRAKLKRCGYRWAPSNGCWQAYRNHNSLSLAAEMVKTG